VFEGHASPGVIELVESVIELVEILPYLCN